MTKEEHLPLGAFLSTLQRKPVTVTFSSVPDTLGKVVTTVWETMMKVTNYLESTNFLFHLFLPNGQSPTESPPFGTDLPTHLVEVTQLSVYFFSPLKLSPTSSFSLEMTWEAIEKTPHKVLLVLRTHPKQDHRLMERDNRPLISWSSYVCYTRKVFKCLLRIFLLNNKILYFVCCLVIFIKSLIPDKTNRFGIYGGRMRVIVPINF